MDCHIGIPLRMYRCSEQIAPAVQGSHPHPPKSWQSSLPGSSRQARRLLPKRSTRRGSAGTWSGNCRIVYGSSGIPPGKKAGMLSMAVTNFSTFLKEEVSKVKGIAYPIKAGFPRRVFIRKAPCSKLHPNPNDEFCFPDIGPNEGIMARYMQKYRDLMAGGHDRLFEDSSVREPLIVERIHPDGYMILTAVKRWMNSFRKECSGSRSGFDLWRTAC